MPTHCYTNKKFIFDAIARNDVKELRAISNFYYNLNGIYERVCNYFAYLYRYDWYVSPEVYDDSVKEDKVLKDLSKLLNFLDKSYIKKLCGDIALEVMKNGCYYAYIVPSNEQIILQQLPIAYCRSRYQVSGMPAIEFNMKFFDTFIDIQYRMKVLNLFPEEFKKGYILYRQGKLITECGDEGWYLLDPESTVKFNYNNSDIPPFVNAIPALLDLDAAQDLDRRKQMQKLLKIVVQKLPMDKNGDLIFDVDEARDIHNNAVHMLKRAVGVDVLTTFLLMSGIEVDSRYTEDTIITDINKKVLKEQFLIEKFERGFNDSYVISLNGDSYVNTIVDITLEGCESASMCPVSTPKPQLNIHYKSSSLCKLVYDIFFTNEYDNSFLKTVVENLVMKTVFSIYTTSDNVDDKWVQFQSKRLHIDTEKYSLAKDMHENEEPV